MPPSYIFVIGTPEPEEKTRLHCPLAEAGRHVRNSSNPSYLVWENVGMSTKSKRDRQHFSQNSYPMMRFFFGALGEIQKNRRLISQSLKHVEKEN